jgi:hypothetical protein
MTVLWPAAARTASGTFAQPAVTGPTTLTWDQTLTALWIMGLVLLLAGVLVIIGRRQSGGRATGGWRARSQKGRPQFEAGSSVVRGWIAISLVIGLLMFCTLTFAVVDPTLRSTLIGGLTASVGSAIAYYFSAKSAEQARQDVLSAHGAEVVPDLRGMAETEAASALGKTSLRLEIDPNGSKEPNAIVETQHPDRGVSVPKASPVQVTLTPPPPPPPTQSEPGTQPKPLP